MSHSERWFISAQISPGGHFHDFDNEVNHRDIDGKGAQSHASGLALDLRICVLPLPWQA